MRFTKLTDELEELKSKMKKNDSEQTENNEDLLMNHLKKKTYNLFFSLLGVVKN